MQKKIYNSSTEINILLEFCKKGNFCPSQYYSFNAESLFYLAIRNKIYSIVPHLATCLICKKNMNKILINKINKFNFNLIAITMLYKKERLKIGNIIAKKNVKALLFKYQSENYENVLLKNLSIGTDLDILVYKNDFDTIKKVLIKNNYGLKRLGIKKELQLIDSVTGFQVDLHFLIAYPHFYDLNNTENSIVLEISKQVFKKTVKAGDFFYPEIEYFFLIQTVRLWYNDLLTGLGQLYEFCYSFSKLGTKFDQKRFLKLIIKYNFLHKTVFLLMLGEKLFSIEFSDIFKKYININIKIALLFYTKTDICNFPPIATWYKNEHLMISKNKYKKYLILKKLLDN